MPRNDARDLDARVILGATVGVMINGYAHEDQSPSPRDEEIQRNQSPRLEPGYAGQVGQTRKTGYYSGDGGPRNVQEACVPKVET